MSTIVFFPFPEFGHINPTLKLAKNMKQAGHRVCYLGFAEFKEYLGAQDMELIPLLAPPMPGKSVEHMKIAKISRIFSSLPLAARTFSGTIQHLEQEVGRIAKEINPDLLILDFLIGKIGYKTARSHGIRCVRLSTAYMDSHMLGSHAMDEDYAALPVLTLCPEAFDVSGEGRKANRYYIEPSVDLQRQELYDFPWDALDGSKPLIYASVGCQPHLYDKSVTLFYSLIDAMRLMPEKQMVLAIGRHLACDMFQPLPSNVIVVNWAPQLDLIKKASLMITHGGLGAIKECILLGVPMIVFPCAFDQPFNAVRIVAHGLGLSGDISKVCSRQVVEMIAKIDGDASFKHSIEVMRNTFREIEESGIGMKVIESILADPCN